MKTKKNFNIYKCLNFVAFAIGIILLCYLMSSCKSTQSIIGTDTQSHTKTTTSTILKDTIVDVHFVAEPPIFVYIPVADTMPSDTAFAENSTSKAVAFISDGKLQLTLIAKDTVIPALIKNAIRETTTEQTTTTKETIVVQQNSKRRFGDTLIERILLLFGVLLLLVLGILITTKRIVK
jgi:hypothetical protein